MSESGEHQRQLEKALIGLGNPETEVSQEGGAGESPCRAAQTVSHGDVEDEPLEEEPGVDPIQTLLNRRYPRIALHRDTLRLLQRVEWLSRNQGINDFCNDAIRYVILAREAGSITFNDLHAASAALDARLDELNVILLHLHQAVGDLSIIVEHQRLIGAYGERLKQAVATAHHK